MMLKLMLFRIGLCMEGWKDWSSAYVVLFAKLLLGRFLEMLIDDVCVFLNFERWKDEFCGWDDALAPSRTWLFWFAGGFNSSSGSLWFGQSLRVRVIIECRLWRILEAVFKNLFKPQSFFRQMWFTVCSAFVPSLQLSLDILGSLIGHLASIDIEASCTVEAGFAFAFCYYRRLIVFG